MFDYETEFTVHYLLLRKKGYQHNLKWTILTMIEFYWGGVKTILNAMVKQANYSQSARHFMHLPVLLLCLSNHRLNIELGRHNNVL